MSAGLVLVIDDDATFRFAMRKALRRLGYEIEEAASGEAALRRLHEPTPPDAALLDLKMGGISGIEVLRQIRQRHTRIIVLTGHGTVEAAVDAMKLGAFSFLEKPVDGDALAPLLENAIRHARRDGTPNLETVPPLVGASAAIEEVRAFIARVGPTDETVAIYGETGTGKEVVARHLHLANARATRKFVALNSACVPETLFESELFGHRKGSFTGATSDQVGLFVEADGGTLFIDEIAELPLESQAKLLRALESRTVRPIGDTRSRPVDVRFLAATNRNLWTEVERGRFREDLFFRLQVFPIVVPPLRQRRDDIPELVEHLLNRVVRNPPSVDAAGMRALVAYDWPGNVRELLNVLRRAALFSAANQIDGELMKRMIAASIFGHSVTPTEAPPSPSIPPADQRLSEVERAHIESVLSANGGNVTKAALALGIDRRTLQRKLRAFGLRFGDS